MLPGRRWVLAGARHEAPRGMKGTANTEVNLTGRLSVAVDGVVIRRLLWV